MDRSGDQGLQCRGAAQRAVAGGTHVFNVQDEEGATTLRLENNGNKLGVDAGERGVPGITGDADAIVALSYMERRGGCG